MTLERRLASPSRERSEEFFRSSLIQTVFYGLFAGWTLWLRSGSKTEFRWEDLAEHLKIPFLAELYYEFQHPRRIQELGLRPHLDLATETLHRVDTATFFRRFRLPSVKPHFGPDAGEQVTAAILYFYEPFLEAFDPELRKSLGVWYTPPEVVRYQVRMVDRLLREELDCDRGLADEKVVVLDPCCGTGAYLAVRSSPIPVRARFRVAMSCPASRCVLQLCSTSTISVLSQPHPHGVLNSVQPRVLAIEKG